jgi:hypothetical protein
MFRSYRLTVRLTETEIRSVRKFADVKHVLPAVAVRWLLSMGLAHENRIGAQQGLGPFHLADGQPSAL